MARELFGKFAASIAARKERLGILSVGLLGNAVIVYAFDYGLYPYVIWKLGAIRGGVVMTLASFLICWLTILFYDWSKKDWIGIEAMKQLKEYDGKNKTGRIAAWIMKKGNVAIMIFLSIKFDPFIVTAYMRHGANKFNGMSRRDWRNFLSSLLIANFYWILVAYTGVNLVEYLWKKLF